MRVQFLEITGKTFLLFCGKVDVKLGADLELKEQLWFNKLTSLKEKGESTKFFVTSRLIKPQIILFFFLILIFKIKKIAIFTKKK